jgi:hypothetical protein
MKFNLRSKKINWMTIVLIGLAGSLVANLVLLYGFFAMKKELIDFYKYSLTSYNIQVKGHR